MIAGIAAALSAGAVRADVVAVEVRRLAQTRSGTLTTPQAPVGAAVGRVVSLTERRLTDPAAVIAGLPPDNRPLPQVTAYDELLPRRVAASASTSSEVS